MLIFDDTAKLDIQFEDTLELIQVEQGVRLYKITGLDPKVVVRDFRGQTNRTLFGDYDMAAINQPAHVTIHELRNRSMLIDLKEPKSRASRHTLSIASGVDEFIPQNDTFFDRFDFRENGSLIYIAIYKQKASRPSKESWSFLSV